MGALIGWNSHGQKRLVHGADPVSVTNALHFLCQINTVQGSPNNPPIRSRESTIDDAPHRWPSCQTHMPTSNPVTTLTQTRGSSLNARRNTAISPIISVGMKDNN